ncbi:hypothetical protein J6590_106868, partial [Homalodisca vitripennis]
MSCANTGRDLSARINKSKNATIESHTLEFPVIALHIFNIVSSYCTNPNCTMPCANTGWDLSARIHRSKDATIESHTLEFPVIALHISNIVSSYCTNPNCTMPCANTGWDLSARINKSKNATIESYVGVSCYRSAHIQYRFLKLYQSKLYHAVHKYREELVCQDTISLCITNIVSSFVPIKLYHAVRKYREGLVCQDTISLYTYPISFPHIVPIQTVPCRAQIQEGTCLPGYKPTTNPKPIKHHANRVKYRLDFPRYNIALHISNIVSSYCTNPNCTMPCANTGWDLSARIH